jgi:3-hydroxyisobutyrate dehydrogenase
MNIDAGTGRMGTAIAQHLIDCRHTVTVWNRTAKKAKAAQEAGARLAATPAELAAGSDVVITILTNADAIKAVYEGAQGLLSGAVKGKLFVEMSTVRPETERACCQDGREGARVECPVEAPSDRRDWSARTMRPSSARNRCSISCVAASSAAAVGAGATMKLAVNLPLIVQEAFGEAMALARPQTPV